MVRLSLLFMSVSSLFLYMLPGFILRKTKIADASFSKTMSALTLYICLPAMLIHGFIAPFDKAVFRGTCQMFVLAFLTHLLFSLASLLLFRRAPEKLRKVLRFGAIFSNAGYMGIPVISDVFGADFVIYATVYVAWFNIFSFSVGRLIYTGDKKYISLREIVLNPIVVTIILGTTLYLTGLGGRLYALLAAPGVFSVIYGVITALRGMVAPISMAVIGARLADISFRGFFRDKYLYRFIAVRNVLFPLGIWALMRAASVFLPIEPAVMAIVLILASTPAAANTTMFAELYGGESVYAGKLVAVSTLLSVISMPLAALLLRF